MNYRALEDLIGILVKKSGYKITDLRVLEDTDYLESRKNYLTEEIDSIKSKLDTHDYIDKDKKIKDEEEKKYLTETLNNLKNQKSELELKLNDKTLKCKVKAKTTGDIEVITKELNSVEELIEVVNYKLDNLSYTDDSDKSKDEVYLNTLERELSLVNEALDNKEKNSILIGTELLSAFKNNRSLVEVKDLLDTLTERAKNNYERTLDEIKGSNIFELIDLYNNKKNDITNVLEKNNYSSDEIKESLFEKTKYHNKRIETFKSTITGIEKRKEELNTLIDESKNLFLSTRIERLKKEEKLKTLEELLFNESNLNNLESEYASIINLLNDEINSDKFLENKYELDIENFNEELRNLDINYNNLHNEIIKEERSLEILNDRIQNDGVDTLSKFEDKIKQLEYTNRINSLYNEQQYLYVNVDVIKEEIESIWSRGDDTQTSKAPKIKEELVKTSMYDEDEEETKESSSVEAQETSSEEPVEIENTTEVKVNSSEEQEIKEENTDDDFLEDIDYFE
mgnify:FL=1